MATNAITVHQYASIMGCTEKNVYNKIYANRDLPGISSYSKSGNTWFLYAKKAFILDNEKKLPK